MSEGDVLRIHLRGHEGEVTLNGARLRARRIAVEIGASGRPEATITLDPGEVDVELVGNPIKYLEA